MMRATDSERTGATGIAGASTQGAARVRAEAAHYLGPEPETPPVWLGIGLAMILVGCVTIVVWTAIVVAGAMGVMK